MDMENERTYIRDKLEEIRKANRRISARIPVTIETGLFQNKDIRPALIYRLLGHYTGNRQLAMDYRENYLEKALSELTKKHHESKDEDVKDQLEMEVKFWGKVIKNLERPSPKFGDSIIALGQRFPEIAKLGSLENEIASGNCPLPYLKELDKLVKITKIDSPWIKSEVHKLVLEYAANPSPDFALSLVQEGLPPVLKVLSIDFCLDIKIRPETTMGEINDRITEKVYEHIKFFKPSIDKIQNSYFTSIDKKKPGHKKRPQNIDRDIYWLYLRLYEGMTLGDIANHYSLSSSLNPPEEISEKAIEAAINSTKKILDIK